MDILSEYLAHANEVVGERTDEQIRYDREVIKWLKSGKDIREAVEKANEKYPSEALEVSKENLSDIDAHYDYLAQHEQILGMMAGKGDSEPQPADRLPEGPGKLSIDQLLERLNRSPVPFPTDLVREVQNRWSEAAEPLLRHVERVVADPESQSKEEYLFLFAVYLLAQFGEKRAFPLFCGILSLPEKSADSLLGDGIHEDAGRLLASVWDGNLAPLYAIIEDPAIDEYQRSATLETLRVLYLDGRLERETLTSYAQSLFRQKLDRQYSYLWDALLGLCIDLGITECIDDIRKAYEDELSDPILSGPDVDETIHELKHNAQLPLEQLREQPANSLHGVIGDTVEELSSWACFAPRPEPEETKPGPAASRTAGTDNRFFAQPRMPVRAEPKPGRNAPCPCGSGKKYKKCCGR
jgi:hypothetical protein